MTAHSNPPPLRVLRRVALVEGTTLVLLMMVAMPLKYLAGIEAPVQVLGPLHGAAFLIYLYTVAESWGAAELTPLLTLRAILAAQIPFGTWLNDRALARQAANLTPSRKDPI